jgi:hypothetical protein
MTDNPDLTAALARAERAEARLAEFEKAGPGKTIVRAPDTTALVFTRTALADPATWKQYGRAVILKAASEGRVIDDKPEWRINRKPRVTR